MCVCVCSQAHRAALRGMRERRPQQSRGMVEPSRTAAEQPHSPHSRLPTRSLSAFIMLPVVLGNGTKTSSGTGAAARLGAVRRQRSLSNSPWHGWLFPRGTRTPSAGRLLCHFGWPSCQNTVIFCHSEKERVDIESPAAVRQADCLKALIALSSPTWSLHPTLWNHCSGSHI